VSPKWASEDVNLKNEIEWTISCKRRNRFLEIEDAAEERKSIALEG